MVPPVCPQLVPVIVSKRAKVLAGSAGSELVQGLLARLGPHVLGREGLLPSVQP
ncbi:unnamed protein product, partial [Prunus brigantina]